MLDKNTNSEAKEYDGECKDLYVAFELCLEKFDRRDGFKKCQTELHTLRKCVEREKQNK
jgi:hypothetical protein